MALARLPFLVKHKRLLAKRKRKAQQQQQHATCAASAAANVVNTPKLRRMDRHIEPEPDDLHSPLPATAVEDGGANSPASIATTISLGPTWMSEEEERRLREEDLVREHLADWENTKKLLEYVQLLRIRAICAQIDYLLSQLPCVNPDDGSNSH